MGKFPDHRNTKRHVRGCKVPRLAPDGTRCKENRMTFGNSERKLLALAIKEQSKNRTQKYISSFALPISILGVAASIGIAGYFMAPSIIQDAKEKLQEVKDNFKNLSNTVAGRKPTDPRLQAIITT